MIEVINADCGIYMKSMPPESVDLVVTSPPYNCGMPYRSYNDSLPWNDYLTWCKNWIYELFRICKPDGRIAVNVLLEMGIEHNTRRVFPSMEFIRMIQNAGFTVFGLPVWTDSHKGKLTAWGSWRSASCPYIYNPAEVIILAYKNIRKKQTRGKNTISKEDFIRGCSGLWRIHPDSRTLTMASFPVELPKLVIELLSYQNDVVLDPFCGSGTTGIACVQTERQFIGIEIDPEYCKTANQRINEEKEKLCQTMKNAP